MKPNQILNTKAFVIAGFSSGFLLLVFGNLDSSDSVNAPSTFENFLNIILLILILFLGYSIRGKIFKPSNSIPRVFQFFLSIILTVIFFGFLSIPALEIRESIDPAFKERHLQTQIADKAAADKAAADKAAADKAAADKAAPDKAAADKAAAEKAAAEKAAKTTATSGEQSTDRLAGFEPTHIQSFKTIVSNIRAYVAAVDSGNSVRASQICDLLDDNYNSSMRGVYSKLSNPQIEQLVDYAKDSMYAAVVDCTRGFKKGRVDLIGDSVTEFVLASKYLDGLVMVASVK